MTIHIKISYIYLISLITGLATVLSNPTTTLAKNKRAASETVRISITNKSCCGYIHDKDYAAEMEANIKKQNQDRENEETQRLTEEQLFLAEIEKSREQDQLKMEQKEADRLAATQQFITEIEKERDQQFSHQMKEQIEQEAIENKTHLQPSSFSTECGLKLIPLISLGKEAEPTEHPWNAAIYVLRKGKLILACGGTLISAQYVLSAAHCTVVDEPSTGIKNKFKIVLGKKYREYNHERDIKEGQYFDIQNIFVPDNYQGVGLSYTADIVIFELKTPAVINNKIMPVCIDRKGQYDLKENKIGKVVGWGRDETGQAASTLQLAEIPFISYRECINLLPDGIRLSLPNDKFCTTVEGGPMLQKGDSGAGFIVEYKDRSYIYGIVSATITANITTLTNVRSRRHLEFIRDPSKKR